MNSGVNVNEARNHADLNWLKLFAVRAEICQCAQDGNVFFPLADIITKKFDGDTRKQLLCVYRSRVTEQKRKAKALFVHNAQYMPKIHDIQARIASRKASGPAAKITRLQARLESLKCNTYSLTAIAEGSGLTYKVIYNMNLEAKQHGASNIKVDGYYWDRYKTNTDQALLEAHQYYNTVPTNSEIFQRSAFAAKVEECATDIQARDPTYKRTEYGYNAAALRYFDKKMANRVGERID